MVAFPTFTTFSIWYWTIIVLFLVLVALLCYSKGTTLGKRNDFSQPPILWNEVYVLAKAIVQTLVVLCMLYKAMVSKKNSGGKWFSPSSVTVPAFFTSSGRRKMMWSRTEAQESPGKPEKTGMKPGKLQFLEPKVVLINSSIDTLSSVQVVPSLYSSQSECALNQSQSDNARKVPILTSNCAYW